MSKKKASDHSMALKHFEGSKSSIDLAYYTESVHNRFAALLKFTIPDASERFKQLIGALDRSPARTPSAASLFGRTAAAESKIAGIAEREHYDHADPRAAETEFWKDALAQDSLTPKVGPFSETWRPPTCKAQSKPATTRIAELALLQAYKQRAPATHLVRLALQLKTTATTDPDVATALAVIQATSEYQRNIEAAAAAAAEVHAVAVEEKKRKLRDDSMTIATQPRIGAANQLPAQKKSKSTATQTGIAAFFKKSAA